MIIEKKKLRNALGKLSVFADKAGLTIPKALFRAEGGKVDITCCDGTNFGVCSFGTGSTDQLAFVTDYRNLCNATGLRGDPEIVFEGGAVKISQGETHLEYPATEADTYPFDERKVVSDKQVGMKGSALKKAISRVTTARDEKDTRIFMGGIQLVYDGARLVANACDAHRAYRQTIELPNAGGAPFETLLSPKAIKAIDGVEDDEEIQLCVDDKAIGISSSSIRIYAPRLNCTFPNTDGFFAQEANAVFALDRSAVTESMGIFAMADHVSVKSNGNMVQFDSDDGVSVLHDAIPVIETDGNPYAFAIDLDIFRDIFRPRDGEQKVQAHFRTAEVAIRFTDGEGFEGVVMPLRK